MSGRIGRFFPTASRRSVPRPAGSPRTNSDRRPEPLPTQPVSVDRRVVQAGHDAGLLRILVPRTFGGLGLGLLGAAVALEEIAAESADAATVFATSMLAQLSLVRSAAPQLQARFLPWFSGDEATLACGPPTTAWPDPEPRTPYAMMPVPGTLTARSAGEFLLINGSLGPLVNAALARFATVFVGHRPIAGSASLTCVAVPMNSAGLVVTARRGARGRRGGRPLCAAVEFDDVAVPEENIIGGFGGGPPLLSVRNDIARIFDAAMSTGIARSASGDRADSAADLLESRGRYLRAARLADEPSAAGPDLGSSASHPGTHVGPANHEIARAALRLDPGMLQT